MPMVWPSVCSMPAFIKFNVYTNHMRYCYCADYGSVEPDSGDSTALTSSQVRPVLLIQGLHTGKQSSWSQKWRWTKHSPPIGSRTKGRKMSNWRLIKRMEKFHFWYSLNSSYLSNTWGENNYKLRANQRKLLPKGVGKHQGERRYWRGVLLRKKGKGSWWVSHFFMAFDLKAVSTLLCGSTQAQRESPAEHCIENHMLEFQVSTAAWKRGGIS